MISRFNCPPCDTTFIIEQWLWQKKITTTMNVSGTKKHRDFLYIDSKFKQSKAPVNIFHSLFKIIETKNV